MTVEELLDVMDLTAFDEFTVNGKPTGLVYIRNVYAKKEVKAKVTVENKKLHKVAYTYAYEDVSELVDLPKIELHIPDNAQFICVTLDLQIKEVT